MDRYFLINIVLWLINFQNAKQPHIFFFAVFGVVDCRDPREGRGHRKDTRTVVCMGRKVDRVKIYRRSRLLRKAVGYLVDTCCFRGVAVRSLWNRSKGCFNHRLHSAFATLQRDRQRAELKTAHRLRAKGISSIIRDQSLHHGTNENVFGIVAVHDEADVPHRGWSRDPHQSEVLQF